jgi:hypothetical protein
MFPTRPVVINDQHGRGVAMIGVATAPESSSVARVVVLFQATGWRQIALAKRLGVPDALGLSTEEWVHSRLGGYIRLSIEDRRDGFGDMRNLTPAQEAYRERIERAALWRTRQKLHRFPPAGAVVIVLRCRTGGLTRRDVDGTRWPPRSISVRPGRAQSV